MSAMVAAGQQDLCDWLRAIGVDPSQNRRVIIDIQVGNIVLIYLENQASNEMFQLKPPEIIKTARIVTLDDMERYDTPIDVSGGVSS